ncbi:tandem-95 repeat protein, partial [candidate division KSB1 bacterium]|nr:tandem-95 repeat protein [candidate division KSB1 bacterium]
MRRSTFFLLLLLFTIQSVIFAQRKQLLKQHTQTTKLEQLSEEFSNQSQQARQNAIEVAREKGWMVRKTLEDGTIFELQRLSPTGLPIYYKTTNLDAARTVSTDKVWSGGSAGLNLGGSGMIIGEWDGAGVRTTHQEFGNRVLQRDDPTSLSRHSTHVAGTLIAGGVTARAKGMSHQATLHAYEWNDDNAEMAAAAANGLLVSNHSYGIVTGWVFDFRGDGRWAWFGDITVSETEDYNFGYYSENTKEWDEIAYNAPYYLIVKSAGNDRNDDGPLPGSQYWLYIDDDFQLSTVPRDPDGDYDCISHNSLAKNILTVGAVNSLPNGYTEPDDVFVASFSSWGPADDGRIKPDIVADGVALYSTMSSSDTNYGYLSGTSMASPSAAGSVLLLQQHYQETHAGQKMLASTLKGLVIHTADEAGFAEGPDYTHGWGLLNTERAARVITTDGNDNQIIENTLAQDNSYSIEITLEEAGPLIATICWTDPPSNPIPPALDPEDKMLINDLDLRITNNGITYEPYILNPAQPHLPATTGDNITDNVEKIYIASAEPGTYTLTVNHKGTLYSGSQAFSLIVSANASTTPPPPPLSNIKWEERFTTTSPPTGWQVVDNDGSGTDWNFVQGINFSQGGAVAPQAGVSFWYSNYQNANSGGLIDEWVISPQINDIETGDSLYFYAGAVDGPYADSLRVYISIAGNQLSDFNNRIGYFKVDGPIGVWNKYGFDLSQFGGENIHIGVNYYIRQGGPLGIHSDNIWLDHFFITTDTTNFAPILSNPVPDITLSEDFEPVIVANLKDIFYDENDPDLDYTISTDGNTTALEQESMLVLSSVQDFYGSSRIIVVASDGRKTAADTFNVTITPVNDAPVLKGVPDVFFLEDSEFMLPLNPFLSDVDHDSSRIRFLHKVLDVVSTGKQRTMDAEPNDLMIEIDSLTHVATFSASPDSNGEFTVELTAVDDSSAAGSDTISVSVDPVNDAPQLSLTIPDTSIREDSGPVAIIPDLSTYFTDPDRDPLEYTADENEDLAVSFASDSLLVTPQTDFFGEVSVRLSASDGIKSIADTFTVFVSPVNDPPVLANMPDITFPEDSSSTLPLLPFVQDIDTDSLRISFSAQVLTAQPFLRNEAVLIDTSDLIVTIDSLSRVATFTSSADSAGQFSVQFTAADDSGAADSDTIEVVIAPVNDSPVLSSELPDTSIFEDSGTNVLISNLYDYIDDPDNPQLDFDAEADSGLQVSILGDSLLALPDSNFFGQSQIRLTASDSIHFIADTFTVTINPVNDPPLLANIPDVSFSEDSSFVLP